MFDNMRSNYHRTAIQKWQDRCRVCARTDSLVALPYSEAAKEADYELGATLAAINGNRIIRQLLEDTKFY
jgi:nuclear transport factor 2 (NTF2) superfamily protein